MERQAEVRLVVFGGAMAKPLIQRFARRLFRGFQQTSRCTEAAASDYIRFDGDYPCWQAAVDRSTGYQAEGIAKKVLETTLQVLGGRFAFERDSVGFVLPEYNWPLLACLFGAAAAHGGSLRVLDYGGALGSVFLQHRNLFTQLPTVDWRIVEQAGYAELGCLHIAPSMAAGELRFFSTIETALADGKPDVLLLSSVLQYLPDPWSALSGLLKFGWDRVILDRTAVLPYCSKCRLTVQTVPEWIYSASYPAWFLSQPRLFECFADHWQLMATWENSENHAPPGAVASYKGFCFRPQHTFQRLI